MAAETMITIPSSGYEILVPGRQEKRLSLGILLAGAPISLVTSFPHYI
jgi:hypothetical protein